MSTPLSPLPLESEGVSSNEFSNNSAISVNESMTESDVLLAQSSAAKMDSNLKPLVSISQHPQLIDKNILLDDHQYKIPDFGIKSSQNHALLVSTSSRPLPQTVPTSSDSLIKGDLQYELSLDNNSKPQLNSALPDEYRRRIDYVDAACKPNPNISTKFHIPSDSSFKQNIESPVKILPPSTSNTSIILAVLFYLVTSIAMVILNKIVLNVFALPLTLLWIQLVFAVIILKLLEMFKILSPFSPLTMKMLIKLSPLILINVVGLAMNTLCLRYLDASLYQVVRALMLPFTVIFSAIILHQKSSILIIISCGVVSSGFLVGIFLERDVQISVLGIIYGIVSSSTSAMHSIIIKQSLGITDGAIDLVYYNNLLSAILLFPLIFIETTGIISLFTDGSPLMTTAGMFLVGSILGVIF